MRKLFPAAAAAIGLALSAQSALAEDTAGTWRQTVFIYGMGAAIDGDARIGNVSVPVDISISDLFDALEFGAMGAYRIDNGTWSFEGDVTFMNLRFNESGPGGNVGARLDTEQLTVMATAGRRLTPRLEALFSLAYFDLSTDLAVSVPPLQQTLRASRDADWIDPLIGLHYATPFADKWSFSLRGDIGGFGIGSDLTWQLLTFVKRQNTERFGWYIGYRAVSYDYESGRGLNYQRYDLTQQGPMAGIAFSF